MPACSCWHDSRSTLTGAPVFLAGLLTVATAAGPDLQGRKLVAEAPALAPSAGAAPAPASSAGGALAPAPAASALDETVSDSGRRLLWCIVDCEVGKAEHAAGCGPAPLVC